MGITLEHGVNFDQVVRGQNVWPRIIDRDTAIKALTFHCEFGPPNILVRTLHHEIRDVDGKIHPAQVWYEVGGTRHQLDTDLTLPAGISGMEISIQIKPEIVEQLIEERLVWMQESPETYQQHCYWTGPGSYFAINRERMEKIKARHA